MVMQRTLQRVFLFLLESAVSVPNKKRQKLERRLIEERKIRLCCEKEKDFDGLHGKHSCLRDGQACSTQSDVNPGFFCIYSCSL